MDDDLRIAGGLVLPASALGWRFSRAGGPGGQGVNTTDSRVELVADLTALTGPEEAVARVRAKLGEAVRIVAAAERSQLRNREAALRRLADRLGSASRPKRPRTPTKPTAASDRRRLAAKRRRAAVKAARREPPADE